MIGKAILFAGKIVLGLFLFMLLASLFPVVVLLESISALALGWIHFLGRVLPEVIINPAAIGMVVICSAFFLWGTQRFCAWLYGSFRSRDSTGSAWPSTWPWRWSVGIYCGLWLLFLTSMSVTGLAHQIGWLIRSDKPIIENRRSKERWETKRAADRLSVSSEIVGWASQGVREACKESLSHYTTREGESSHERWQTVFIETKAGITEAVFIAYRDPELRHKYGYHRVTPKEVVAGPIERMAEDIRTFTVKPEAPAK